MHTDDICNESGLYLSLCRDRVRMILKDGETFPKCPTCTLEVDWELIRGK